MIVKPPKPVFSKKPILNNKTQLLKATNSLVAILLILDRYKLKISNDRWNLTKNTSQRRCKVRTTLTGSCLSYTYLSSLSLNKGLIGVFSWMRLTASPINFEQVI